MSTRNLVILGAVVAAAAVLVVVLRRREALPMLGEAPAGAGKVPASPGFISTIATEACVSYTGGKGSTQCAAAGKLASKFASVAGGAVKKVGSGIVSGIKKIF